MQAADEQEQVDEHPSGQDNSKSPTMRTAPHDNYSFAVNTPGIRQDDLSVQVVGQWLCITGKTTLGSPVLSVDKLVQLPVDADIDAATSSYQDGTLYFTVPLRKRAPTRFAVPATTAVGAAPAIPPLTSSSDKVTPPEGKTPAATSPHYEHKDQAAPAPLRRNEHFAVNTAEGAVLAECAPSASNVQIPDEASDEFTIDQLPNSPASKEKEGAVQESQPIVSDDEGASDDAFEWEMEWENEWEAMLDELVEMGFEDRTANRAALTKHAGSLRLAVRELVQATRKH